MTENEMIEIDKLSDNICTICGTYHNCYIKTPCTMCRIMAKALYADFNYRKIPDGSVVLTKEDYDNMINLTDCAVCEHKEIERASKETAKEILNDLRGLLEGYVHTKKNISLYKHYCHKYGLEAEE